LAVSFYRLPFFQYLVGLQLNSLQSGVVRRALATRKNLRFRQVEEGGECGRREGVVVVLGLELEFEMAVVNGDDERAVAENANVSMHKIDQK